MSLYSNTIIVVIYRGHVRPTYQPPSNPQRLIGVTRLKARATGSFSHRRRLILVKLRVVRFISISCDTLYNSHNAVLGKGKRNTSVWDCRSGHLIFDIISRSQKAQCRRQYNRYFGIKCTTQAFSLLID